MGDTRFWSSLAKEISPYVPGEQPQIPHLIKLNTNENPYPPSPKVVLAIQNAADASLRLYPDPESLALRTAIAKRHGIDAAQVFVGNGSDEVLALAFLAYFDRDKPFRMPDITYSFYPVYARLYGMKADLVPLDNGFKLPIQGMMGGSGGAIFANPNAPTSIAIGLDDIRAICDANCGAVIVDEAYVEFGADSAIALLPDCPNLVVIRTFSKSHALAGLRVGYAIAAPDMLEALVRVKNSFNSYPLDRVAQAAANASIEDERYCQNVLRAIVQTRTDFTPRLEALGFHCLPSKTNFLFATHATHAAAALQSALREHGILVRRFNAPRIDNHLRITIGTDDEMERLLFSMRDILS